MTHFALNPNNKNFLKYRMTIFIILSLKKPRFGKIKSHDQSHTMIIAEAHF